MIEIVNIYNRPSDSVEEVLTKCPACGYYDKFRTEELQEGMTMKCPHCTAINQVPPLQMPEQIAS